MAAMWALLGLSCMLAATSAHAAAHSTRTPVAASKRGPTGDVFGFPVQFQTAFILTTADDFGAPLQAALWHYDTTYGRWLDISSTVPDTTATFDIRCDSPVEGGCDAFVIATEGLGCLCDGRTSAVGLQGRADFQMGSYLAVTSPQPVTLKFTAVSYSSAPCVCPTPSRNESSSMTFNRTAVPATPPRRGPSSRGVEPTPPTVVWVNIIDASSTNVTVTVAAEQTQEVRKAAHVTAKVSHQGDRGEQALVDVPVTFVGATSKWAGGRAALAAAAAPDIPTTVLTDENGEAHATYTRGYPGPFGITAYTPSPYVVDGLGPLRDIYAPDAAVTLWRGAGPAVDTLSLRPHEVHARCDEPVRLTATARAAGAPVAGLNVSFALSGDCLPFLSGAARKWALTDAAGEATLLVASSRPGEVAAAAAAVSSDGKRVGSKPARILFESHHSGHGDDEEHIHHRERHGWNAEYSEQATQQAKAMLSQLPVAAAAVEGAPQQ